MFPHYLRSLDIVCLVKHRQSSSAVGPAWYSRSISALIWLWTCLTREQWKWTAHIVLVHSGVTADHHAQPNSAADSLVLRVRQSNLHLVLHLGFLNLHIVSTSTVAVIGGISRLPTLFIDSIVGGRLMLFLLVLLARGGRFSGMGPTSLCYTAMTLTLWEVPCPLKVSRSVIPCQSCEHT